MKTYRTRIKRRFYASGEAFWLVQWKEHWWELTWTTIGRPMDPWCYASEPEANAAEAGLEKKLEKHL